MNHLVIDIDDADGDDLQGWAYNVWNITNSEAAVYMFQLDGEKEILFSKILIRLPLHFVLC